MAANVTSIRYGNLLGAGWVGGTCPTRCKALLDDECKPGGMWKSVMKLARGKAHARPMGRDCGQSDARLTRPRLDRAIASLLASSVVASGALVGATWALQHPSMDQLSASVVSIRVTGLRADPFDPAGDPLEATRSAGAGFVVTAPSGARFALTNNHVIKDAYEVFVDDAPSLVVYADSSTDVAALLVAPAPSSARPTDGRAPSLCAGEPELGVEVAAIGDPYGFQGSLSRGVVSGLHRAVPISPDLTLYDMVQTDALLNPGNSGGPLFDLEKGCVLGMNTVIMTQPNGSHTGIGFAVPSRVLSDVVRRVDAPDAAARTAAGADGFSVMPDAIADALGISGAVVSGADVGSQLQGTYRDARGRPFVRDIIVGFRCLSGGGVPPAFDRVASASDLDVLVHSGAAGGGFVLQVVRGDGLVEIQFNRPPLTPER